MPEAKTLTPAQQAAPMKCPVNLEDVDLFGPGAQEFWFESYEILHRDAPVFRIPGQGTTPNHDCFVLTRYEDVARVVRDLGRFPPPRYQQNVLDPDKLAQMPTFTPQMNAMGASMATLRPNWELWKAHKTQLTDPWVGSGAPRHTEMVTVAVNGLIDNWINRPSREIDFVTEFSAPLPQIVMSNVLGFPLEDMPILKNWGEAQVKRFVFGKTHRNLLTVEEEIEQAQVLGEFSEYVQGIVDMKRKSPGDDMISWLCDVTYEALDRKLTDLEIIGIVYAMHLGGLETTQYALAEAAQVVAKQPEIFTEMKNDRSKVRLFVEEALRYRAPTQGLSTRMTTQDEVFQGVPVPTGSVLHLRWGAANLDPNEYECPYEFRLDRAHPGRHVTFSQGLRSCPGAGISRLEQNIAWNLLCDRINGLEFVEGKNDFAHQPGIMLGTYHLNMRFIPA
ncbi:MAG: cytochrome P450 [Dehalococcoidia bacterium]